MAADIHRNAAPHAAHDDQAVVVESNNQGHGPHYFVDIEGTEYPWPSPTITTEDIARLGKWDPSSGVIEVDKDNIERTLAPGEVIELKPGHGFSKKVRWKRGDTLFGSRLDEELHLIRSRFPHTSRNGEWFHIPVYPVAGEGWNRKETAVAFRAQPGYPAGQPYAFLVPSGLRFNGGLPQNYQDSVSDKPPFPGDWGQFSWLPDDGQWRPSENPRTGTNLLNFALGFADRFRQGA